MKFIKIFVLLSICSTTTQPMAKQGINSVCTAETALTVSLCATAAICAYGALKCQPVCDHGMKFEDRSYENKPLKELLLWLDKADRQKRRKKIFEDYIVKPAACVAFATSIVYLYHSK